MLLGFLGFSLTASLGSLFVVVAIFMVGLFIINPKSGKRVASAVRAQAGNIGRYAANVDPMTAYRQALDDEADSVNRAASSLADADVLVRSVTRQLENNRADKMRYEARIKRALADGNEEKARDYAQQLSRVEQDLATNSAQLELHKATYAKSEQTVKARRETLAELRNEARSLSLQLELSKQEVAAASNNVNDHDEDGRRSKRDAVLAAIDKNRATAQVSEVGTDAARYDAEDSATEASEAADAILARFKTQV